MTRSMKTIEDGLRYGAQPITLEQLEAERQTGSTPTARARLHSTARLSLI